MCVAINLAKSKLLWDAGPVLRTAFDPLSIKHIINAVHEWDGIFCSYLSLLWNTVYSRLDTLCTKSTYIIYHYMIVNNIMADQDNIQLQKRKIVGNCMDNPTPRVPASMPEQQYHQSHKKKRSIEFVCTGHIRETILYFISKITYMEHRHLATSKKHKNYFPVS